MKFAEDVKLVNQDSQMEQLLQKEVDFTNLNFGSKKVATEQNEVDFVLHWEMPLSGKKGFFVSFKQELKANFIEKNMDSVRMQSMVGGVSAAPPAQLVHVAFDFKKQDAAGDFEQDGSVPLTLDLSITP